MTSTSPATFAELSTWTSPAVAETSRPRADTVFRAIFSSVEKSARDATERGVAAMSNAAVLARFESLGDNCEFGIVQKSHGVAAGGLLAFARTPPDVLAEILRSDLRGVSDPDVLRLAARPTSSGPEYVLMNERYGIVYHVVGDAARGDDADVVRAEAERLRGLEVALRGKLARGKHIFVMKCNETLREDEARGVLLELRRHGRNALLYVVEATAAHAEGSVIRVAPDLYRGHIGRFAPYRDAHDTRIPAWTAICRNALRLHEKSSRGAA